jgi:hypothetical protein
LLDGQLFVSASDALGGSDGPKRHVVNPNINTNEKGLHTGFQRAVRRGEFGVDDVEVDNAPLALVIGKHL